MRHGRLPSPLVERMKGTKGRRVIADIGLEGLDSGGLFRGRISPQDSVVMRAGNAIFRAVFRGVDRDGFLIYRSFNNGRLGNELAIGPDESHVLWHGMRMDFSSFVIFLHRLPREWCGKLPQVELRAHFEKFIEVG